MNHRLLEDISKTKPVLWLNDRKADCDTVLPSLEMKYDDIAIACRRFQRFEPLIQRLFPETEGGVIESPLVAIPNMQRLLKEKFGKVIRGSVYLKCDSHLKIAGSVKARGGIYEVLKHTEELVLKNNLLNDGEDYSALANGKNRAFFSQHTIMVGSTGNLALSIGIIASALGYRVVTHMSCDAKQWKKDLLRSKGVQVVEHSGDYTKAVEEGRYVSGTMPDAYFVDDERSRDLFLGYSVAAIELKKQLDRIGIRINEEHPLYVYLPCGCGGAPGGITFGLKHLFGDVAHCFIAEPTHSPCMLLSLITNKYSGWHVNDFGIDNRTEADGLAVGTVSQIVPALVDRLVDGGYTIEDEELFQLLVNLKDSECIKIEPSAAAGLKGPILVDTKDTAVHVCWATGGLLLPPEEYNKYYAKGASFYGASVCDEVQKNCSDKMQEKGEN